MEEHKAHKDFHKGHNEKILRALRVPFVFFVLLLLLSSCANETVLQEVKKLDNYPSASAIEFYNGHIYLMGDDANGFLVMDSSFAITDSIQLYNYPGKRIPKSAKPDLEAISLIAENKILLTGSGSLKPQRYIAWVIDPLTKEKNIIPMDTFYNRILLNGIAELNLEGLARIPASIIISNRGSKGYRKNHLLFTSEGFWNDQSNAPINIAFFGTNTDTSFFNGVSGLCYASKKDKLIATISTENTTNSMDDGAIGKSYLWIVKNISSKTRWKAINPDKIIDLEKTDVRFKGQKIESACILKETRKLIYLLLAADNDDGSSTLFKLVVPND